MLRTGNDRSVKTIRFLEQYAKLCTKYDREIVADTDDKIDVRVRVEASAMNAEALALIKNLPEA